MIKKVKRWFWGIMSNVAYQIGRRDICELCEEEVKAVTGYAGGSQLLVKAKARAYVSCRC